MDRKFNLDKSGNTESIISLKLLNIVNTIDVKTFVDNYKISNFFKGKFFIKRLINKIFKYKLQQKIQWDSNFWDSIEIINYQSSIEVSKKIININEFENKLNKNFSSKKIKKIYKLKRMINHNIKLDFPLFITGESLNLLGSNIPKNSLYMLDGSRRCIAYILNEIREIDIYLITIKILLLLKKINI